MMFAHVGGSLTERPVKGFHKKYGPGSFWPTEAYRIGKGTVKRWLTVPSYFAQFDAQAAAIPFDAVWLMLCTHDADYGSDLAVLRAQADDLVGMLRDRTQAPLYLSGMFPYLDNSCPATTLAVGHTNEVAVALQREGVGLAGPVLSGLHATQLANGRCDQNAAGRAVHGDDLHRWLG